MCLISLSFSSFLWVTLDTQSKVFTVIEISEDEVNTSEGELRKLPWIRDILLRAHPTIRERNSINIRSKSIVNVVNPFA